jgi:hypothetical protein
MNKIIFFGIALLAFTSNTFAQFEQEIALSKKLFPKAKMVQLRNSETLNMSIEKSKIVLKEENITQHYILNSSAYPSEKKIAFIPDRYTIDKIDAQTIVFNGDKVSKYKVKNIEETERLDDQIFYDDMKFKRFFYIGVQAESITDLKFTATNHNPYFIAPYYFSPYSFPLLKSEYKVIVDKNIEIAYRLFGDTSKIKFNKIDDGKKYIYTWTLENLDEEKSYNGVISYRYTDPHIIIRIKKYTVNGKTENVLNDLNNLYKYKYKYLVNVNKDDINPDLKALADSIKSKCSSKEETIQQIFYWVKDHVKYIAFEDGDGGYTPRNANDIFLKRYGDCKDYSSIIKQMLNTVGIEAHLAWIGTTELPYDFSLNTPGVSNHMIVAVPLGKDFLYLDGTSFNTPYNMPSGFIQGKETMISINADSFVIRKVPEIDFTRNSLLINHYINIEGNSKIKGRALLESDGLMRAGFLDRVYNKDASTRDESNKNYLSSGNNKCKILEYKIENESIRDSALRFKYTFEIEDYVKNIDDKYYINLNFNKQFATYKIDTVGGRSIDYNFSNKISVCENYYLDIPEHLAINKLPENLTIENDKIKFISVYKLNGNKLFHQVYFEFKKTKVEPTEFTNWNKNIELVNQNFKQVLVLVKKK